MTKTKSSAPTARTVTVEEGIISLLIDGDNVMSGATPTISFHASAFPLLAKGSKEQLEKVRILQDGHLLYWVDLDAELPVGKLLEKLLGFSDPSQTGRIGGQLGGIARSQAKIDAARVNGAKGGRPRKHLLEGNTA